jgi:two-component system, LytTR family, response regulator
MPASEIIRVVIVDDEPLARTNLRVLLERDSSIEIVAECGSGPESPATIRRVRPDLLFLDVQMPECDGFDVLELLGPADLPAAIVFVTAYDHHAIRAFEAGALDYLLKPFDNARFELSLSRARQKIAMCKEHPQFLERIAIKSAGQIAFVSISEIDWIEAADYYAALHIGPRTDLLRRSLSDLESDLDPALFCRVHRSAIVNLARVRGLRLNEDGDYSVLLADNVTIRLSRRYRRRFQSRLGMRDQRDSYR